MTASSPITTCNRIGRYAALYCHVVQLSAADDEVPRRFFLVGIPLTVAAALGTDNWRVQP